MCFKMAKLNSEKRKKSSFYEEKSLVGLTPEANQDETIYRSSTRAIILNMFIGFRKTCVCVCVCE